jgi:hypothetical protein
MQKIYLKHNTPSLKKRSYALEYGLNYLDLRSCIFICLVLLVLIASILCVAAYPNSNMPIGV